jgi:uncharacterized membrane protein HdeD (DUF308 family)
MTMNTNEHPFAAGIKHSRNLLIALGTVMILAGFAAIVFPFVSSLGVVWMVAIMLIIASIAQSVSAFSFPKWGGVVLGLIVAALWLIGGLYLLTQPLEGVFILTVFVAAVFVVEGVIKTFLSIQMRPLAGWGWLLFDGLVSIVLGAMLWWQLPLSALWALGTLAGISIMISGWTLVMMPIALDKFLGGTLSAEHAT